MSADGATLFLMAKAPVAGAVKTRMQPALTADAAAALAGAMLEQTLATAHRHWHGEVRLCVSDDHPTFRRLADAYALTVIPQVDADLGTRMLAALRDGVANARAAAVVGCDVPHCTGAIFARASVLLMRGENVIGPAADGGFYFLGLQRETVLNAGDALFAGVQWSGARVLSQVRANAVGDGDGDGHCNSDGAPRITLRDLPSLRDIDRYADLQWLAEHDSAYQPFVA